MAINYCSGSEINVWYKYCHLIIEFQNYLTLWAIFNSCFLVYIENRSISFSLQKSVLMAKGIYLKLEVTEI